MLTEPREKPAGAEHLTPAQTQERRMWQGLDYLIDEYRARQNEIARKAGVDNHGIFEKRLGQTNFTDVPHIMLFYYVRIDNSGLLQVVHYRYVDGDIDHPETWQPIEHSEERLGPLIEKLASNARPSGPKIPAPDPGGNFEDIKWDRKSYVAIFVDEANWQFHQAPNENPAVVFLTELKNGKTGAPNHSFFDAMDFKIRMPIRRPKPGGPTSDLRSAIVFINHMKKDEKGTDIGKNEDGTDAGEEQQFFQFEMFLDVAFASGKSAPMTVIFDPGGTNMGPPVPPP
jgi:hypothetical protein